MAMPPGLTNKPHTNANLERELRALKAEILAMGRLAGERVGDAVRSFVQRDTALASRVV